MQVLCLYEPRKFKPKVTSELRKQQYTVTLCDYNHLAHVSFFLQRQKFIFYFTVIALFYLQFEGNFQLQAPGRDLSEGFLGFECQGLIFEGLIFGILSYACLTNSRCYNKSFKR